MVKKIIELSLVSALIIAIFYLGNMGYLKLLINPTYYKFIYLSLIILFLFFVNIYLSKPDKHSRLNIPSYIFFAIIIIISFTTSYSNFQENISEIKGVNLGASEVISATNPVTKDIPWERPKGDSFEITDNDYLEIIDDMYRNIDEYIGKEVTIKGYVYHTEGIGDNFILSRLVMVCCAADCSVYGLLCSSENIEHNFVVNEWYEVKGIIGSEEAGEGENKMIHPLLIISEFRDISVPEDPYIYPKFF